MKDFKITIKGDMPLLMHASNIEWDDRIKDWQKDAKNKAFSVAGDDRTPPWRWIGYLPHDGEIATVPTEYLQSCIMSSGAEIPTGKGRKNYKSQTQTGIIFKEFHWPLLVHEKTDEDRKHGKTIPIKDIKELLDKNLSFKEHCEFVEVLGFSLFVKAVNVNGKRHIRVRPRFDNWSSEGIVTVTDEQLLLQLKSAKDIKTSVLHELLWIGGHTKGLGDWRPGAPKKPGPWGVFSTEISFA